MECGADSRRLPQIAAFHGTGCHRSSDHLLRAACPLLVQLQKGAEGTEGGEGSALSEAAGGKPTKVVYGKKKGPQKGGAAAAAGAGDAAEPAAPVRAISRSHLLYRRRIEILVISRRHSPVGRVPLSFVMPCIILIHARPNRHRKRPSRRRRRSRSPSPLKSRRLRKRKTPLRTGETFFADQDTLSTVSAHHRCTTFDASCAARAIA